MFVSLTQSSVLAIILLLWKTAGKNPTIKKSSVACFLHHRQLSWCRLCIEDHFNLAIPARCKMVCNVQDSATSDFSTFALSRLDQLLSCLCHRNAILLIMIWRDLEYVLCSFWKSDKSKYSEKITGNALSSLFSTFKWKERHNGWFSLKCIFYNFLVSTKP